MEAMGLTQLCGSLAEITPVKKLVMFLWEGLTTCCVNVAKLVRSLFWFCACYMHHLLLTEKIFVVEWHEEKSKNLLKVLLAS